MLACAQLVEPGKKRKIGGHTDGDVLRRPLLRGAWSISENALVRGEPQRKLRGVTGRDPSGSFLAAAFKLAIWQVVKTITTPA